MVREGKFREDLFYRLQRHQHRSSHAPCASVKEDIPLLVEHFLRKYSLENGSASTAH